MLIWGPTQREELLKGLDSVVQEMVEAMRHDRKHVFEFDSVVHEVAVRYPSLESEPVLAGVYLRLFLGMPEFALQLCFGIPLWQKFLDWWMGLLLLCLSLSLHDQTAAPA